MKKKKTFDMLNGSIWNKLILFALPLAASSILQQLFNAADVAVVGSFAGSGALAAVGANGPIINLLVNSFVGLSVGANVVIASFIGQNDEKRTSLAAHTSVTMSVIIGIVLLFVGFFFARPILELMSTPEDIINLAEIYLKIYFLGVPFVMLYNFAAAILRSKGDTQRPLIALFIGGVINVILNLFFVVVLHMSVEVVAIGPVISNVFSSDAIAASSAALNYEYFAYYILSSFAQAAVTFIGQNYSAKKYDRCKKITLQSFLLGGVTTMVACMIFVIFDHFFISFFTSDISVASLAYTRMKIILPFQFLNMSIEVFSSVMRGVGYSSVPAGICVAGICGVRLAYLYTIYPSIASYDNLLIIYPISWFVTVVALALVYFIHVRPKVYSYQAAN